jgi:hypothetical protein
VGLDGDRRSVGRTHIDRSALLFFKGQRGARGCGIIDISRRGAKFRMHQLPVLPLTFELTFDNFVSIQRCQLIWRKGDLIGAAFEN